MNHEKVSLETYTMSDFLESAAHYNTDELNLYYMLWKIIFPLLF